MLPNFIVVGSEKAGTTSLASALDMHPDVFMCKPKEPRFFTDHNWDKGLDWYKSLFEHSEGFKAIGEASPAYTWAPESIKTPERIYKTLGDIKYVYILRNPVDRMVSHYRHALYCNWVPSQTSIGSTLSKIPELKECSKYFYQIEQYLPFTKREQWHIILLEELIEDYQKISNEMFDFLGIENFSLPELPLQNASDAKIKNPTWLKHIKFINDYLPSFVKTHGKQLINKLSSEKKIEKPDISEELRMSLIEEFKPDIQKLSDFYGKDFQEIWNL